MFKKLLLPVFLLASFSLFAQSEVTEYKGFINFSYDNATDKITLEIERLDEEFLYVFSLATGVGSNDIGLDRGQLGGEKVVKFTKMGQKIMLVQPNYDYRANSTNPDEVKAVKDAFAESILWGFPILREENGKIYVDATTFLMQDAHGVAETLRNRMQGNYSLDASRSAFYLDRTKNFPENTEFETTLTFTGSAKGRYIRSVTPSSGVVTVRQHHSFVKLPDSNYQPREFDPRAGYFAMSYMDYATPISENIEKRFIMRHRLEKVYPKRKISKAIEPIIYYLDRGTPEPIRSALMEGATWWNQAFEAIGYEDAFQVKLMPEGADPMDVRYNTIQWVHRSTRGWSYGGSVSDPRTGEIIKGHVTLGSLRARQDYLIAEGLLAPYKNGDEIPKEVEEMALARLRQLAAHEVGHTIGLAHSYASSTEGRASVMDYPHPLAEIKEGKITLQNAYDNKIGDWDKVAIAYGYQHFPKGTDEATELNKIIQEATAKGLTFLSDQDARPTGGAHPFAHLWDNGKTAHDGLNDVLAVRALALKNFGEANIKMGEPYAKLEEVLVPIYFYHRYQLEATAKVIGGLNYRYALRGDGQLITQMVEPATQKAALSALLKTLSAETLALPEALLNMIPPRPIGYNRSRELAKIRTSLTFDPLATAEASASMTLDLLLHPARAQRLLEYNARNEQMPSLTAVIDQLLAQTWQADLPKGYHGEIQKVVNHATLNALFKLGTSPNTSEEVKALVLFKIEKLYQSLSTENAHHAYAKMKIEQFKQNPAAFKATESIDAPAGSPIGCGF